MKFLNQEVHVLAVGEVEKTDYGFRTTVQMFDGDIAGPQRVYGEEENLKKMTKGIYLADLVGQQRNYGVMEHVWTNLRPKQQIQQPTK
jgi:hypothetical protein